MKQCPSCKYKTGYDFDTKESHKEEKGPFLTITNLIHMERKHCNWEHNKDIYGCPVCGTLFMQ